MPRVPLTVVQRGRPPYAAAMIEDCCDNLRMPDSERRLLRFYGGCSTGFAPSLSKIAADTNLAPNKIWTVRDRLVGRGLLRADDATLSPDWFRIRAFAMMDRQTKRGALHAAYTSPKPQTVGQVASTIQNDPDAIRWHPFNDCRKLSEDETYFLDTLMNLSLKDWENFLATPLPPPGRTLSVSA